MGIYSCSVADIVIAVIRRLCVVLVHIKTRAGWVGVYLKAIVTCAINFLPNVDNFLTNVDNFLTNVDNFLTNVDYFLTLLILSLYGCRMGMVGGWVSIVAASQTLLLSSLDDCV